MKIVESGVRLDARHELSEQRRIESATVFGFRGALQEASATAPAGAADAAGGQRVRLLLEQLLASMMECLTGEKCRCRVDEIAAPPAGEAAAGDGGAARTLAWSRRTVEHVAEKERTEFAASGKVRTADGREIDFELSLTMCREFECTREYEESGRIELRDPLVINYAGRAAELTDLRFDFDLDADGRLESLPALARGSGYLCLDVNGNGCIDDGRELFGALSGDGFADLKKLDADGNGWIDEADPVFAALGVWFPDGELKPLKETGVGALYLGSVRTPFALKDADNGTLGQIRKSGVYLAEDGGAGTLQQIDLGVSTRRA
ncbi:MAG: hypothetical protein H3C26_10600 [Rhodocyclaceae bacterium]|nr:hypothetical protein [Rhodocyclaceae bacterium]